MKKRKICIFFLFETTSAVPRPFFGVYNKVFNKKSNIAKTKFVRGPKNILNQGVQNRGPFARKLLDVQWPQTAPFLKRFADTNHCKPTTFDQESENAKKPNDIFKKLCGPDLKKENFKPFLKMQALFAREISEQTEFQKSQAAN